MKTILDIIKAAIMLVFAVIVGMFWFWPVIAIVAIVCGLLWFLLPIIATVLFYIIIAVLLASVLLQIFSKK